MWITRGKEKKGGSKAGFIIIFLTLCDFCFFAVFPTPILLVGPLVLNYDLHIHEFHLCCTLGLAIWPGLRNTGLQNKGTPVCPGSWISLATSILCLDASLGHCLMSSYLLILYWLVLHLLTIFPDTMLVNGIWLLGQLNGKTRIFRLEGAPLFESQHTPT